MCINPLWPTVTVRRYWGLWCSLHPSGWHEPASGLLTQEAKLGADRMTLITNRLQDVYLAPDGSLFIATEVANEPPRTRPLGGEKKCVNFISRALLMPKLIHKSTVSSESVLHTLLSLPVRRRTSSWKGSLVLTVNGTQLSGDHFPYVAANNFTGCELLLPVTS